MSNIRTDFETLISNELNRINQMENNSKEKNEAMTNLIKLYELKIEEDKFDYEMETKDEGDKASKVKFWVECALQCVGIGVTIFSIVKPIKFYEKWLDLGFEFEKEGTYTSQTFRGLFGKFKPTK